MHSSLLALYLPTTLFGSIDSSPIVTISFFNLTFNLTNGFISDTEYLISKSENPFIDEIKFMANFKLLSPDMVPFNPSSPTKMVPYMENSLSLIRIVFVILLD